MIIDLHSDTIQRAKDEKLKLTSKKLSVNLEETMQNLPYIQALRNICKPKIQ
ncbi:unknown [Clostridium sp. CAG:440]|jgi:hypothetical protein|nr:unknown [Clostridium sp. CAG:440]